MTSADDVVRRHSPGGSGERRELLAVRSGVRRLYGPVVVSALVALWLLVGIGLLGIVIDRPPLASPQAALEHWWVALPRIGVGDTLAVLAVLATVVIALSLTGDGAPRRNGASPDLADPHALARDLFREEVTVAASAMGMLAAFMGVLGLIDAAEVPATFSTGPVGEAVAVLALAAVLAAVAAMADRNPSEEVRAVEAQVRAAALDRLEARLRVAVGGPVPRSWGRHPYLALRRPLGQAAQLAGGLALLVGVVVAFLRAADDGLGRAVGDGLVTTVGLTALALVASAATLRGIARHHGRTQHRVRRGLSVADVPVVTWWLVWTVLLLVVLVWAVEVTGAGGPAGARLAAWAAIGALVLPVPLWVWRAARPGGLRRRLVLHGCLTDRVPALRETYSQALRVREHAGPAA